MTASEGDGPGGNDTHAEHRGDARNKPDREVNTGSADAKSSAEASSGDGNANSEEDRDKKAQQPRSKKPLIIVAIIVLVVAIVAFFVWFAHRNQVSTDDAFTDGNAVSMVPKVSGFVVGLYVDDNSRVRKDDVLVRIDPRDYLTAQAQARAQLSLAEAQLLSARDALRIAQVQFPAQLETARAQQQAAAAAASLAQASFERQHAVDKRATTQESIDSSTSQQQNTLASLRGAKAQVTIAGLVPEQVRQAGNAVAEREAAVQQARAQLQQASLNLSYAEVRAPADGFITLRNVQLGSFLTAGQVMFVLVTPDIWITANFKESQIGRMRPGDKVEVKVDAYSGYRLQGHVQSIQAGSGSRFSAFPAENATGNFIKIVQRIPVKIVIDSGLDPNAPPPLGLSVSPVVYLQ